MESVIEESKGSNKAHLCAVGGHLFNPFIKLNFSDFGDVDFDEDFVFVVLLVPDFQNLE